MLMRRISLHNSLAVSPNGFSCVDDVDAELTRARPRLLGHRRTKMRDKQSVEVSDGASGHQGRPKRLGMAGWIACLPAHIFVVSLYCRGQSMKNKEASYSMIRMGNTIAIHLSTTSGLKEIENICPRSDSTFASVTSQRLTWSAYAVWI